MIHQCNHCSKPTHFLPRGVTVVDDEFMPDEYSFWICQDCKNPVVFLRQDWSGDGFDDDEYFRVFPPQERTLNFPVPDLVKDSYNDAVRCETHNIWTACVVMVGRTLEAVAKEHVPAARNMGQGLKMMLDKGIISQEIYDWSSELRVIRNFGAHATVETIDREDAKESMDFLRAILETFYYMRPKFKQMKERRAARSDKK